MMAKTNIYDAEDTDTILVLNVSYHDILKQKKVLTKLLAGENITNEQLYELQGTLHLLDFMQDNHSKTKKV